MSTDLDGRSPFERLLGPKWSQLPEVVRQLHGGCSSRIWAGRARVERGTGWLSRLLALAARLPPAAEDLVVRIELHADGSGAQRWVRHFGNARMPSRLWVNGARLSERLGLVRLDFALHGTASGFDWQVVAVRALGVLPLPAHWFRQVKAGCGRDSQDRYRFDIEARLPWVGLLVAYEGWLLPIQDPACGRPLPEYLPKPLDHGR